MLILSRADVEAVLELDALRRAVGDALSDVSAGRASMPPRIAARVDEPEGLLGAMPAYLPALSGLGTKLVSLFPGNAGGPLPTHQAVILLFDAANGQPIALMDGTHITAVRTAAASALSVEHLARPGARILALLGSGVQARAHADAVVRVRDFTEIRVAGRTREHAERLVAELSTRL